MFHEEKLMKKISDILFSKPVTLTLIVAIITNIFIEVLSRNSISALFAYIAENPLTFIFNTAIIMLTLSVSLFFKRQLFTMSLVTLLWVALGIANKFMLISGNMPLTIFHIFNFGSAIKLSSIYMTVFEIILIFAAIIVAIVSGYFLWRKIPKSIRNIKKAIISSVLLLITCSLMGFATAAQIQDFSDIPSAYEKAIGSKGK